MGTQMPTELIEDHHVLRGMMRDFASMMDDDVRDMALLTRWRIRFAQLFRDHMGREDMLARGLRQGPLAMEVEPVVHQHGRTMVALFLRYSDHIKQWTPAQIMADWDGYRRGTLRLQDMLYDHMEWEEAHLHPLIEGRVRRAA